MKSESSEKKKNLIQLQWIEGRKENNSTMEDDGGTTDAIPNKENCTDNGEEDLCRPQNVEIAGFVKINKNDAGLNTLADGTTDCKDDKTINRLFLTEPIRNTHCNQNTTIEEKTDFAVANRSELVTTKLSEPPTLQSPQKTDDEVTSASKEINKNKTSTPLPIPALPLKKLESFANNITICREKGKERAFSYGDISNSEDDIHESAESCNNSAGLFSKCIKRQSDDDQRPVIGNKRMKKQITDSSFMKWISNMVKGLPDSTFKEDCSSIALTLACQNDVYAKNRHENFTRNKSHDDFVVPNTGFRNIFRSLYCKNTDISGNGVRKENDSTEECRELMAAEKNVNSCKQIVVCGKEVNPIIVGQPSKPWIFSADINCSSNACTNDRVENKASGNLECDRAKDGVIPSDSLGKQMNITEEKPKPEKNTPLNSLWITRFSTRTPRFEKHDEFTQETNDCSTNCPEVDLGIRPVNDVLPIDKQKCAEFKSVFARRLDALRHILPSKRRNPSICSIMCFFCGHGHDVHECPDITKNELEELLLKLSSFDDVEEFSGLCIRCFQLDHWAVSCPLAPSSRHLRAEQNGSFVSRYTACRVKLSAGKGVSTSNEIGKNTTLSLAINDVNYSKKFPLCNIVTAKNKVAPSEIFHAIRNLRLSRSDILRWMNSNVSLSYLNGFFLRLRLGKVEEGLRVNSYYVACITGDAKEHNGCKSKKSILVDVGGIKSSVGSRYVSNHDFLEEEIKAWWCRTVDSGCKIPSLDELNSKFNDRKNLGI